MTEPCCIAAAQGAACDCSKMDALALAYGLLWHMWIDRRDPNLKLASEARTQISNATCGDKTIRARGIELARKRMKQMRVEPLAPHRY